MPFIQPSIEGELTQVQDPWDWSVDEVLFALTDPNSQLLRANGSLLLPNPNILSNVLRENDVNGLALLTEVNAQSLREEMGIRSMSYRASINHLIRQLQDQSLKYRAHFSGRTSSIGGFSRLGTPYLGSPQSYDPRATSRVSGLLYSPSVSSKISQNGPWTGGTPALGRKDTTEQERDILAEAPELPRPDCLDLVPSEGTNSAERLIIDRANGNEADSKLQETTRDLEAAVLNTNEAPDTTLMTAPNKNHPESNGRQGETIIIDDNGKKRRRLNLAGQGEATRAENPSAQDSSVSLVVATRADDADLSHDITPLPHTKVPVFEGNETPANTAEPLLSVQANTSGSERDAVLEPGVMLIDHQGRKRMRPLLLSDPNLDSEEHYEIKFKTGNTLPNATSPRSPLVKVEPGGTPMQRTYGRMASRKADQTYLGFESLPIDKLFYGDTGLEKKLDDPTMFDASAQPDQADGSDEFILHSSSKSNGHRLYVNARMKHFLQSRRMVFRQNGREHIGVVPYPNRIGKKHHPLSVTIFSTTLDGVIASRSNRSKWIKDKSAPASGDSASNEFNVADPALARDEDDDPDWKALEKWKYLDGEDLVLPIYGDSDSEGEYDIETWHEIEEEEGSKLERPMGPSKTKKMTGKEVAEAIDVAIEQMIEKWKFKRRPKLELRSWRLWVKSRRDGTAQDQISEFSEAIEKLAVRIANLRKEIAGEEWSKANQVIKQCQIIQPSLFDREDYSWHISLLQSKRKPEKTPRLPKKPKVATIKAPREALKDDEEDLTADAETSESSNDSLEDFVVDDDVDGDAYQPVVTDDDLTMADVEDGMDSDTLLMRADDTISAIWEDEWKVKLPTHQGKNLIQGAQRTAPPHSSIIDLTQSDPVEPETSIIKPEPSFEIKTPPICNTDDDSDLFERSRGKKPVFKTHHSTKPATIIILESESTESYFSAKEDAPVRKPLPPLNDVEQIRAMEWSELVERQDRKRLLIWLVAHTPSLHREGASEFLGKASVEKSHREVVAGLKSIKAYGRRIRGLDKGFSDSVMRVATWYVCWTIPVKADSDGLQTPHIEITLADEDGFEPFYDFLLECLEHYRKALASQDRATPKKRRQRILLEDSDEPVQNSPFRKRKFFVPESQETLDQRQAAQERLRGNEERRRREELKSRFAKMGASSKDSIEVVVNPGKLEEQEFVYLNPRFGGGARLKPHQKEGLQFLWREITGDHDDLQGCLLAQTMGLGKTMQVIAVILTLAEASRSSLKNIRDQVPSELREARTLVLCPPALIENWWDEFLLWPPKSSWDLMGKLRKVNSAMKSSERLIEIDAWSDKGGILLIGFDTFKGLIHNKGRMDRKNNAERPPALSEPQHRKVKEALLERPNLVVADEAHQFKNRVSGLALAMNQIKTRSRIALTGSPLNNNLAEYYALIDWIAPNYLGTYTEFKATYEEPIQEGLYRESTDSQYRESRKRLKALELEMEPKVHRANLSRLHAELKGKMEYVIRVPLTSLQEELYRIYVECMRNASRNNEPRTATLWSWLNVLRLLCNHPKCFWDKLLDISTEVGGEGSLQLKTTVEKKKIRQSLADDGLLGSDEDVTPFEEPVSQLGLSTALNESKEVFNRLAEPLDSLSLSNKTQVLMNILEFSEEANDKVLVFSHSIPTLNYVGNQLGKASKTYARMDGKTPPQKRQQITKHFNESSVNICLISTRAGGQGLNLYGANRVVILDDHWNPMWEQQAIGRAYRIGQQKPVYVYRLTVGGTFEQAVQNQALFKEQLATRVVDKKNPNRHALKGAGEYLFPPKTVKREELREFLGKDPLVLDRLLANQTEYVPFIFGMSCANFKQEPDTLNYAF